jgi:hypothetical protein
VVSYYTRVLATMYLLRCTALAINTVSTAASHYFEQRFIHLLVVFTAVAAAAGGLLMVLIRIHHCSCATVAMVVRDQVQQVQAVATSAHSSLYACASPFHLQHSAEKQSAVKWCSSTS